MAALFGADDQVAKRTSKLVNWARPLHAFVWSLRTVAPEGTCPERAARLRAIRNEGQVTRSLMRARCYRGAEIARKLGFSEATAEAIRALDEHWDGHGQPHGLRETEIPLAARILCLAQTVEVFHADGGRARRLPGRPQAPRRVVRSDAGRRPGVVPLRLRFWAALAEADVSESSRPTAAHR